MRFVIDTNVFIASVLKDGLIREIITNSYHEFLFPEVIFKEIENHKEEFLDKSGLDVFNFDELLAKLIVYVNIIPNEKIELYKDKAKQIVESIDPDDAPFFATSLAFGSCPIWSQDGKLKEQKEVIVYNTKEILDLLRSV
ncbi:MAG: PIN domain-containing protein [Nanoarchaeota archaeon]